jgi:hypothetical protein
MITEADYGATDQAMNRGSNAGDETLLVKFYIRAHQNQLKSKEAGRPIWEDTPFISIMSPGSRESSVDRRVRDKDKHRFPQHWKNFQARESQEIMEGTPLSEWAGIQGSQVEELKFLNVQTIEQLVSMSDVNAQNIRGIYALKDKAKAYLASATDGLAADALKKQLDINASLMERLKVLEDSIVSASIDAPKRGRPKKAAKPIEE